VGRFTPYDAKSKQAKDIPSVLSPSILSTFKSVIFEPSLFVVLLGMLSPLNKKIISSDKLRVLAEFSIYKYYTKKKKKKNLLVSKDPYKFK
jgi:hypothetical protein